jgi:DNA-binding beta-propeller fold protein YncE
MLATATARSRRRCLSAAIVGALALNSAATFAAPFVYVPENGTASAAQANFFARIDLSNQTETPATPIAVINNPTADPRTAFSAAVLSDATGKLFISDQGNAKAVLQVDVKNITNATTSLQATVYTTGGDPKGLTVDHSGKHVFVTTFDGQTITVIDTSQAGGNPTDVEFQTSGSPSGAEPADVKLNLSGTVAYVSDASTDQRLCRFNAVAPPFADGIPDADCVVVGASAPGDDTFGSAQLNSVAVSPDGTRVYVLGRGDSSISVVDVTKSPMQLLHALQPGIGTANGIAINQSGKLAYVTNNLGHLFTLDLTKLDQGQDPIVRDLIASTHLGQLQGLSISADGRSLLVADNAPSALHIIDLTVPLNDPAPTIKDITVPGGPVALATSPDDRVFVSEFGSSAAGG